MEIVNPRIERESKENDISTNFLKNLIFDASAKTIYRFRFGYNYSNIASPPQFFHYFILNSQVTKLDIRKSEINCNSRLGI